jgi:hypothetical protein
MRAVTGALARDEQTPTLLAHLYLTCSARHSRTLNSKAFVLSLSRYPDRRAKRMS